MGSVGSFLPLGRPGLPYNVLALQQLTSGEVVAGLVYPSLFPGVLKASGHTTLPNFQRRMECRSGASFIVPNISPRCDCDVYCALGFKEAFKILDSKVWTPVFFLNIMC